MSIWKNKRKGLEEDDEPMWLPQTWLKRSSAVSNCAPHSSHPQTLSSFSSFLAIVVNGGGEKGEGEGKGREGGGRRWLL